MKRSHGHSSKWISGLGLFFTWTVTSTCGSSGGSSAPAAPATDSGPTTLPKSVSFSGFVQRAFELTVNGTKFNDSEHFYTRFIPDLILSNPDYAASLKDTKITVDGEYGLDKFGTAPRGLRAPLPGHHRLPREIYRGGGTQGPG